MIFLYKAFFDQWINRVWITVQDRIFGSQPKPFEFQALLPETGLPGRRS